MAEWVVLELTPQGEDEDPDVLRSSVLRILRGSEIFVPASISVVGDSRMVHKLMDNYVFVKRDRPDVYYYRVEGTKYIATVLTAQNGKMRQISTVKDSDISKMRRQIQVETDQGIEVGDEVEIMSGAYKGIRGRVIEEIPENEAVQVYISLRSKQAIVTLPRSFLRFVADETNGMTPAFSPFRTKYLRITEWFRRASVPLSIAIPQFELMSSFYTNVAKLHPWVTATEVMWPDIARRRQVARTPFAEFDTLELKSNCVRLLYNTYRLTREMELAPSLLDPPTLTPVVELADGVNSMARLAVPLSVLAQQVASGEELSQWQEPSCLEAITSLQSQLKVYDASSEAIKRLKYQIGQVELKLKKAEQEDAKERKRRTAKRNR